MRFAAATAAVLAALALGACDADSGKVIDRKTCSGSECISVQHGTDATVDRVKVPAGQYPGCVKGKPWPECKDFE